MPLSDNVPPPPGLPEPEVPRSNLSTHVLVLAALDRLDRIEGILNRLCEALADEEEEEKPSRNLDGDVQGGPRDQTRSLG